MIRRIAMEMSYAIRVLGLTLLVSVALLTAAAIASADAQEEPSTIDLVAIDAVIDGNDATTLGPLDGCVEAEAGSEVVVDVTVDAVPEDRPAIAFQLNVDYDPEILRVTDYDAHFLLSAVGKFEPIEGLTDELPDGDGAFTVAVLDVASNEVIGENVETGAGTLVRVTFETLAEGTSAVEIGFVPPDVTYPAILSDDNQPTQVDNIGAAVVSVGAPCRADAEPVITPLPPLDELIPTPGPTLDPSTIPEPEGGGVNYGLLAGSLAIVAVGVVGVAGGSWLFYRKHRS